jgi:type IV pilus assembly protein PilA
VQSIKTINGVQYQYQSQFGKFATSLAELGPPQSGTAGPSASDLIPGDLAAGEKSGYKFTLSGTEAGYVIHATPSTFGTTGNRTFYSDQSGVIRQNFGQEPATESSPEFK